MTNHSKKCHYNPNNENYWPIKNCPKCGKEIRGENTYCSQACANGHTITEDHKKKVSSSLKKYFENHDVWSKGKTWTTKSKGLRKIVERKIEKCPHCGGPISDKRFKKGLLCNECYPTNKLLSDNAKRLHKEGKLKSWQSRSMDSYAEKFWIKVLDNNGISYVREKKIGKYFMDFYIPNLKIDLEIDGKQHEYEDRRLSDLEKTKFIENEGISVYRIKWNPINKEEGKLLMKQKIDDFLNFIGN